MNGAPIYDQPVELDRALELELACRRFPFHVSKEEVRVEAIETLWRFDRPRRCLGQQPIHWLLRTAKRKLLEISRRSHFNVRPTSI
ncbi:MAG: hypothetical protein R3E01_06805 [Pirellulaceae bacterium]|nr:hypothetical protein [Planctomycetales bacterium]